LKVHDATALPGREHHRVGNERWGDGGGGGDCLFASISSALTGRILVIFYIGDLFKCSKKRSSLFKI